MELNENESQNNENIKYKKSSEIIKQSNTIKLIDRPIQIFYEHNYVPFELLIEESCRLKNISGNKISSQTFKLKKAGKKGKLRKRTYLSNSFSFIKNSSKLASFTKRSMSLSSLDKK